MPSKLYLHTVTFGCLGTYAFNCLFFRSISLGLILVKGLTNTSQKQSDTSPLWPGAAWELISHFKLSWVRTAYIPDPKETLRSPGLQRCSNAPSVFYFKNLVVFDFPSIYVITHYIYCCCCSFLSKYSASAVCCPLLNSKVNNTLKLYCTSWEPKDIYIT